MNFYNIITSARSVNSYGGLGKIGLVLMEEQDIINIASQQANRRGEDLRIYTDIEMIGINPDEDGDFQDFKESREWREGEYLEAALAEFRHDGHIYEIFKSGEQDAEFIVRASDFGLENEAIDFVT